VVNGWNVRDDPHITKPGFHRFRQVLLHVALAGLDEHGEALVTFAGEDIKAEMVVNAGFFFDGPAIGLEFQRSAVNEVAVKNAAFDRTGNRGG